RQVGTNPEAMPYNAWLLESMADFLASVVAPNLAARYPRQIAAVSALAQRLPGTGMGQRCVTRCVEALHTSRYLPAIDGGLRMAGEALLLPAGVANAERAHRHLELEATGRLMIPAADGDAQVRAFLRDQLDVAEWPLEDTLDCLRPPEASDRADFYEML